MYQHLDIHQSLLHKPHPLFFRQIICRKNTIKSWFILKTHFLFQSLLKDEAAISFP